MTDIYKPSDDSFMLADFLKKEIPELLKQSPETNLLEVGSGTGIQLETVNEAGINKKNIFSCDINPEAVEKTKQLGFNCIESDLFENISGKYNLILFNPPYLPEDKDSLEPEDSKISTTGGKKGNETIIKFLEEAKNYLKEKGKIFLITSSLSEEIDFESLGYKATKRQEKKLFFEKIELWELEKITS